MSKTTPCDGLPFSVMVALVANYTKAGTAAADDAIRQLEAELFNTKRVNNTAKQREAMRQKFRRVKNEK